MNYVEELAKLMAELSDMKEQAGRLDGEAEDLESRAKEKRASASEIKAKIEMASKFETIVKQMLEQKKENDMEQLETEKSQFRQLSESLVSQGVERSELEEYERRRGYPEDDIGSADDSQAA